MKIKKLARIKVENRLQATIDIGSHSCILLIAAFDDVPVEAAKPEDSAEVKNETEVPAENEEAAEIVASTESATPANSENEHDESTTPAAQATTSESPATPATRKLLVPKLQKVEVCRLGEDIYEHGKITPERIQELVQIMTKFRMDLHALGVDLKAVAMTEAVLLQKKVFRDSASF